MAVSKSGPDGTLYVSPTLKSEHLAQLKSFTPKRTRTSRTSLASSESEMPLPECQVQTPSCDAGSRTKPKATSLRETLSLARLDFIPHSMQERWWHPRQLVRNIWFEIFYAVLILLQACGMAIEVQLQGLEWGYQLNYDGYTSGADAIWPPLPEILEICDLTFGCLFAVEVVVKVWGLGRRYFKSFWNFFDLSLVLLWCLEMAVALMPMQSPSLRLLRLIRLLRLVKPLRTIKNFDSLIIMTTALKHSMGALFWASIIMLVVEVMLALLLGQLAIAFARADDESPSGDTEVELKIFEYFGTFPRSMLTMFQMTLGTWVTVARDLQELITPAFNLLTILFKGTFGFAAVGVINGVFMQETMKVAQTDDIIMMRDVARREKVHSNKMTAFFQYTDHSRETPITRSEWNKVMERDDARHWFGAQGLPIRDPDTIFNLIDSDNSDSISIDELVFGVSQLQGVASGVDVAILKQNQIYLMALIEKVLEKCEVSREVETAKLMPEMDSVKPCLHL